MKNRSILPSMRMIVSRVYEAGHAPSSPARAADRSWIPPVGAAPQEVSDRLRGLAVGGGFTLLEVMIAMAILAITLVAVFQSQSQSLSMAGDSRFLTTASLLAQSRMVVIDAADPREVKAGSGDFGEAFPDYGWQVGIADTEIAALKKITVTVTNNGMAAGNAYRLVLYKVVLP